MRFRKGVLGLETVGSVMRVLLLVAVLAIAMFLTVTVMKDSLIDTAGTSANTVVNESDSNGDIAFANQTGYVIRAFSNFNYSSATIDEVWADTGSDGPGYNVSVPLANISFESATGTLTNATVVDYSNVSVSYTWNSEDDVSTKARRLSDNTTTGTVDFFSNASTFFTLLGVVVILLIIGLVIVAVNRFSGSEISL